MLGPFTHTMYCFITLAQIVRVSRVWVWYNLSVSACWQLVQNVITNLSGYVLNTEMWMCHESLSVRTKLYRMI